MAKADRTLEKYRAEWGKLRKKLTLSKALTHCREKRVPEPAWLHDAIYKFGRDIILKMKKTGRHTDLLRDDRIYSTVEDYLQQGLTQTKAWELTAERFSAELPPNRGEKNFRGEAHGVETVKSIWLCHKKRIVKVDPDKNYTGFGWRFKNKDLKNDKNAWMAENIPPYLRTKNK
jgi:hypothetical protein